MKTRLTTLSVAAALVLVSGTAFAQSHAPRSSRNSPISSQSDIGPTPLSTTPIQATFSTHGSVSLQNAHPKDIPSCRHSSESNRGIRRLHSVGVQPVRLQAGRTF